MLARKYGLHGFFFGLLLPVVFFIWKNTMPLVPPRKTENHQQHDEYKTKNDTLQGLVHLLRRGITKQQILNNCVKEWEKSGHREIGTDITARIRQIARQGGVIRGNTVDPVAGYNLIGKLISQRKS